MKLISCYIENFGGLSQYALDFEQGVTVIQEPNGFGKTTLAEFLRAMLYGFPRKAKTLDKSKRQKYTPWNGGKFGGNLVFEHEGVRYRLERTFGATPRGDSFRLIDLATNKKSDRFSEEIGLELFQLDSDSFERSTYMPQLHDAATLTTTGIQAKLGDLVEDANDLGNYDKAILALKAKRSSFIPYKGNSGSVAEAAAQVTRLQRELDQTEAKKEDLRRCEEEIDRLEDRLRQKNEELEEVRHQKELAAAAEKRALLRRQYASLMTQQEAAETALAHLAQQYPAGIPDQTEIDAAQQIADRLAALRAQQVTTQGDLDALKITEENKERFAGRIPRQEELDRMQQKCEEYAALTAQAGNACLSDSEEKQYRSLKAVFDTGALEESKLDALAEQNRLLLTRQAALDSLAVSEEDRLQMKQLGSFFAGGVPAPEQIDEQAQALAQCESLRQENAELAAAQAASPIPEKPGSTGMILALAAGAAGIVAGIVLLVMQNYLFGGICLGIGIPAIIIGIVLNGKLRTARAVYQQYVDAAGETRRKMEENESTARELEQRVRRFVGHDALRDGLAQIRHNLESFLALREKLQILREKRGALAEEIEKIDTWLHRELENYFGSVSDYDKAISHLRLARGQYLDLQSKKDEAAQTRTQLNSQAEAILIELSAFFASFSVAAEPERLTVQLSSLRRDAENYVRAREQAAQWQQRKEAHETALARCAGDLGEFFHRFGLTQAEHVRHQLQQLRDDEKAKRDAAHRKEALSQQLADFRSEHAEALDYAEPEQAWDQESLKWTETRLNGEITLLTRSQLEQKQNLQNLRTQIDRIPEIRDELERWQEKRLADQKNANTLDDTMAFLEKARDSLTTSYLGPIRESFESLLKQLSGEEQQIFISPDLDVQLERYGQARELAYFSAGQTDLIVLCMRFALVDALFGGEKPFVVLDDPFVNLDDQRTAEARKLLQELGRERQIIYLTCNSSRSL